MPGASKPIEPFHLPFAFIMERFSRSRTLKVILLALAIGGATACVNLEPRQSNIRYYVLSDAASPDAASPDGAASIGNDNTSQDLLAESPPRSPGPTVEPVIGIRKVRLANYLRTPTITTRFGAHEVRFAEFHRWGEDLGEAIGRTVAQSLAHQSGIRRVDRVPWPDGTSHHVIVEMRVLRFEGEAPPLPPDPDEELTGPGSARVVVAWELVEPGTEDVLVSGRTDHQEAEWTVGDFAGLVQRLDASLDVVARDLAAQIRVLGPSLAERRGASDR